MYGSRSYGSSSYASITEEKPILVFNATTFSVTATLNQVGLFTAEITSNLPITTTLHAPSFTIQENEIIVKINTVDVSDQINFETLFVLNNLYSDPDSAFCEIISSPDKSYSPSANDEIEITVNGTKIFGGLLVKITKQLMGFIEVYSLEFKDWTEELGGILVAETYDNEAVEDIIDDIFSDSDLSDYDGTTNVSDTTTINRIVFDNVPVTEALDKLASLSGKNWYVSPDKDIYFFADGDVSAPFGLTDTNGNYIYNTLKIDEDLTQLRNKVTIKGSGIAAVTVQDATSQSTYGLREYFERNNSIDATNEATQLANSILNAGKDPVDVCTFETKSVGLYSGQQITIQSDNRSINKTLLIQSVEFRAQYQNKFVYSVNASSQRLNNLRDMLENNLIQEPNTPAIQDQTSLNDIEFSAVDDETISWTSGTITMSNSDTYSISSKASQTLTGDHIIYFDPSTSTTNLQISTDFADGIGVGKIPLAYASKSAISTKGATIFPIGMGGQMQLDGSVHITNESIFAGQIAANTITANKMSVTELSSITANFGSMTSGTVTGAVIRTATSGRRMKFSTTQRLQWLNGASEEGYITTDGSGNMVIDADNTIQIQADGTGDDIVLVAGDDLNLQCVDMFMACSGNWQINESDTIIMNYNSDNAGDQFFINEDGGNVLTLDTGKDATFQDDVDISGTLSKGGGSFKIDHPLKPETHYLFHSFVESPEMINIYKGRGKIEGGKYVINLPDYFSALNKDIEYSLIPIGKAANLYVSKEHENNTVEISSDIDCDFSWFVYGVRQDKFALANPIIEEVEKNVKGYIHPELYGETQNLGDKIISENIRRKRSGEKQLPLHNKKGIDKIKSQSKIDKDALNLLKQKSDGTERKIRIHNEDIQSKKDFSSKCDSITRKTES